MPLKDYRFAEMINKKNIIREIRKETAKEKKEIRIKIKLAFDEVENLKVAFLEIDKNMEKMILFGSLAENKIKSINFDIDIAVKSKKYYQLVGRALQSDFKVDVIDLDTIHKKIKNSILENGEVLYEKK